jgi:hypothetical protein
MARCLSLLMVDRNATNYGQGVSIRPPSLQLAEAPVGCGCGCGWLFCSRRRGDIIKWLIRNFCQYKDKHTISFLLAVGCWLSALLIIIASSLQSSIGFLVFVVRVTNKLLPTALAFLLCIYSCVSLLSSLALEGASHHQFDTQ